MLKIIKKSPKSQYSSEDKIEIYLSFLDHILETGDFEKFVLAVDKGFVYEVTYSFIANLIVIGNEGHNKCARYCMQNFYKRIDMKNKHIKKTFIRIAINSNNFPMEYYLKKL